MCLRGPSCFWRVYRSTPSKPKPSRAAARRDPSLSASHAHSTRRNPQLNSRPSASQCAYVAAAVPCSAGACITKAIAATPVSGTMSSNAIVPSGTPLLPTGAMTKQMLEVTATASHLIARS